MAEIQTSESSKRAGVRRSKRQSTRVDLTPMVDLGFLLITFFLFTTSMARPTTMKIIIPADGDDSETATGKTISLLLAKDNLVYYYNGDSINNIRQTDFSASGLRAIITVKKEMVKERYGNQNETVVLIKPLDRSSYGNVVNALDEMQINQISRYVLMDASNDELAMLSSNQ